MNVTCLVLDGIGYDVIGEFDNGRLCRESDEILDIIIVLKTSFFLNDLQKSINIFLVSQITINVVDIILFNGMTDFVFRRYCNVDIELSNKTQIIYDILLKRIGHGNCQLLALPADGNDHGAGRYTFGDDSQDLLGYL